VLNQTGGIVYLVGAGPGDPGLLTLRGAELLALADFVIYDHLAAPELLRHSPTAELIYVGKKAAQHAMPQEGINALLVEKGRAGKKVVRLKGGDPFVFGRGGEECEALAAAGIPFEVVPGITAAVAAAAYAGIPVTHRDFNSSITLITGHEKEEENPSQSAETDIDWTAMARLPCVAFYMGVKSLPRICRKLIEAGKSSDTPAASIQWGTTPRQRTVVGTLGNLPEKVAEAKLTPPAITIVGKVVSMRPTLNWFEKRPLFGQTIVVTRTRQQSSELSGKLAALGAGVIEAPTIELSPPADMRSVDNAIATAGDYDWIIFTSANGVAFTKQRLWEMGKDVRLLGNAKIAAIGDATAKAVKEDLCRQVDLCPDRFVAEALADALAERKEIAGKRFLLLRADIARTVLKDRLNAGRAAKVDDIAIYETRRAAELPPGLTEAIDAKRVTWITFTSSSTAKNFCDLLGPDYRRRLSQIRLASIGPITSQTLRELGLTPNVEAETFNIPGLVEAIQQYQYS